jgi:precorrin-4/cobalt-precorrin-4 C11-methyltransferase
VIDRIVSELLAGGLPQETPAAVVYRATWEDEMVIRGTLADIGRQVHERHLARQALILVGPAIGEDVEQVAAEFRSHLYREDFSHSFRIADSRRPAVQDAVQAAMDPLSHA